MESLVRVIGVLKIVSPVRAISVGVQAVAAGESNLSPCTHYYFRVPDFYMGVRSGAAPPLLLLPARKYTVGGYGGGDSLPPKDPAPYQRQIPTCGLFRTGTVKKGFAFSLLLFQARFAIII